MTLTAATCFSGIGAPEVAMPGWDWKFHAEIEKFPSAVMAARHPDSVNLGDVLAPDFIERAKELGPIDVMAGGPPCQGFSVAGLRGGMSDPRGNLTLRWVQILHAIQPRNAVTENVPGWLSMPDNAFGSFLAGLVGADDALHSPLEGGKWPGQGMASGPRARCAWRILDAQYCGVAQRRRRVFVVADFGNGADPAQVLFERQGLQGNTPPSREKGKDVAGTIAARTRGGGGLGTDFEAAGGLQPVHCAEIAPTLNAHFGDKQGLEDQHINGGAGLFVSEVCGPITAGIGKGPRGTEAVQSNQLVGCLSLAVGFAQNQRDEVRTMDVAGALAAEPGMKQQTYVAHEPAAFVEVSDALCSAYNRNFNGNAPAYNGSLFAYQEWAVRRLTPVECARLQGFEDNYLDISFRNKPAADGNKYKALGNSWAVPCGKWILERIERFMP